MSELTQQEQEFFSSGGETEPEASQESAPVEQAATEPAAQVVADTQQESAEPKLVPLAALHEARAQTKALKAQIERLSQERAQMETWKAQIEQRLNPQPQAPAFEENPAEHLRSEVVRTKEELAAIKKQAEDAARETQFSTWYQSEAAKFAQSTPDFFPTYNALIETRRSELSDQGLMPQQVAAKIKQEEQLLAMTASQLGMNPAQLVYQTAVAKGLRPATQPAQVQAPPAADKLQRVAEGIKSSKSLSQVPGRPNESLTFEYLASLPDSEFRKMTDGSKWEETMSRLSA